MSIGKKMYLFKPVISLYLLLLKTLHFAWFHYLIFSLFLSLSDISSYNYYTIPNGQHNKISVSLFLLSATKKNIGSDVNDNNDENNNNVNSLILSM